MQVSLRDIDRLIIATGVIKKILHLIKNCKTVVCAIAKIEEYLENTTEQIQNLAEETAP